jgi:hypothetical protein
VALVRHGNRTEGEGMKGLWDLSYKMRRNDWHQPVYHVRMEIGQVAKVGHDDGDPWMAWIGEHELGRGFHTRADAMDALRKHAHGAS